MKFLFIGTPDEKTSKRLEEMIEKRGHSLTYIDQDSERFYDQFAALRDHLLSADAIISDTSVLDNATGFQLAYAVESSKPALVLHYTKTNTTKPNLAQAKNKSATVSSYDDLLELEERVDTFVKKVQDTLDAKLFMIIPPDVNKYLEWISAHTKFSKSDIVRTAVLDVAKKDKDYQAFLKKFGAPTE